MEKVKYDPGTYILVPSKGCLVGRDPIQVVVFMWLASFNGNDDIHPSVKTLMQLTGKSKPTILRAIKGLTDDGLVFVERRQRSDGGNDSNRYYINLNTPCAKMNWSDIVSYMNTSSNADDTMVSKVEFTSHGNASFTQIENSKYKNLNSNTYASSANASLADATKKEAHSFFFDASTVASQPPKEKNSAKREKVASPAEQEAFEQLLDAIGHPGESITAKLRTNKRMCRINALRARMKDLKEMGKTWDEFLAMAKRWANHEWRKQSIYRTSDYILDKDKFDAAWETDALEQTKGQQSKQKKTRWV